MQNNKQKSLEVTKVFKEFNGDKPQQVYYYAVSGRNGLGVFDDVNRLMLAEQYIHQGFCCRKFVNYGEAVNVSVNDFLSWPENSEFENMIPTKLINNFFYWKSRFRGNTSRQEKADVKIIYERVKPNSTATDFSEILG